MKIIILMLLFGLLGYSISKPLETTDATEASVEIEKQRLIKFPEDLEQPGNKAEDDEKHDEAKRILQEIEKINHALGYVRKQSEQTRSPAILDSSQYLFPNTGYQPFHAQNTQIKGANGETLLLPSIRSVNLAASPYNKASEYNVPPTRKSQKPKTSKPAENPLYFKPTRVELPAPQSSNEAKLLPTHFVIPVRLYKQNKQQYIEKHAPQEYKIKGYKIVGDIDHFYGKTKFNKSSTTSTTTSTSTTSNGKVKSPPKYHLFFLPEEIIPKTALTDIKAIDGSNETSSREEKLAHRPYKVQTNTQAVANGNAINATSSSQIVKKRLVPKPHKGSNTNSILSASASTVVKVQSPTNANGQQQQQQQHQQQQQNQQTQQQQQHKPLASLQQTQIVQPPESTPSYSKPTKPIRNQIIKNTNRPLLNLQNSLNNNNNAIKNRPLLELQNNINSINNATQNAIKQAFQNIFKFPFRQQETNQAGNQVALATTEYTPQETMPLPMPQQQQQHQQHQQYFTSLASSNPNMPPQTVDHLNTDYKWDDENNSMDSAMSDDQDNSYTNSNESSEPEEKKIFGHLMHQKQETQKEALRQGGIIIQKLRVRKGGIAIAGPGGVATAGSGGTAIVGPGGYALTHPRSLTIAGPGAKIIAIPANVDLKDALHRTNLDENVFPREGRIVATGPTVYYAPPTGDYLEF